jgi:uncharacterized protein YjbJ (UPF0337 family)
MRRLSAFFGLSRSAIELFASLGVILQLTQRSWDMDKDRVKGSAQQAKGFVKETAGKVTGDSKLETEGKADKMAGKVRNTVGGMKDAIKGK